MEFSDDELDMTDNSGVMNSSHNTDSLSLKHIVHNLACKHIHMGTAVLPQPLQMADIEDFDANPTLQDVCNSMETPYARVIRNNFTAVVVEHHLKWAPLTTDHQNNNNNNNNQQRNHDLGHYDFTQADFIVDWCLSNDIIVKGHVLVWHVTSPKCLSEMTPDAVRGALKQHIFTVMGHFRGRIAIWDVVNEALAPDGTLASTVFLEKLGPTYIEECFRWAHEADPKATLLYNDNKVEGLSPKSDAFYHLLQDLMAKGVPVHGCGLQAHFNAAGTGRNRPPTPHQVKTNIRRLGNLGLKVNISEMDVRVSKLERHKTRAQQQIYHDILAAALSEPAFDGIWLWGFTDRHTWVHSFYYDDEPCIFDEHYQKKPAYDSVRQALLSLCPGHRVGGDGVLLDSDVDGNGNPWGHEWMVPEPEEGGGDDLYSGGGDARPDWEQPSDEDESADGAALSDSNEDIEVAIHEPPSEELPPIS